MSGRLSSCSVVHDEVLSKKMHGTPKAPTKTNSQITPRKSDRKRSLFQPKSPSNSEDLGIMSPISPSTESSEPESIYSPLCSPNGRFTTPTKFGNNVTPTPGSVRRSPRQRVEVKSGLFPDIGSYTPKTSRTPRSRNRTPKSISKETTILANESFEINNSHNQSKVLETPSTKSSKEKTMVGAPNAKYKRNKKGDIVGVAETDSSPSTVHLTPLDALRKQIVKRTPSPERTNVIGLKTISPGSFYGPASNQPKARLSLFREPILDLKTGNDSRISSSGDRKRSLSNSTTSSRTSNSYKLKFKKPSKRNGYKIPNKGVWHAVKKGKKKKVQKISRPVMSPRSRIMKQIELEEKRQKLIKRLEAAAAARIHPSKKRPASVRDMDDEDIIDSFPDHRINRKLLPGESNAVNGLRRSPRKHNSPVKNVTPDPNKKFMKYGSSKRATFTLNKNIKLQYSNGIMKLQSPTKQAPKRRKLYSSPQKGFELDFTEMEKNDEQVEENIEQIIRALQDETDIGVKDTSTSPDKEQVPMVTEGQLFSILENPLTRVNLTEATPSKIITEVLSSPNNKVVSKISSLALNEITPLYYGTDTPEQVLNSVSSTSVESASNVISTMGGILSATNEILEGGNCLTQESDIFPSSHDSVFSNDTQDSENALMNSPRKKLFSLFYKDNWSKQPIKDLTNLKCYSNKKRVPLVPDDQYLLDAGQNSIGIVTCQVCGVMYQAGDFADEATHKNFHNRISDLRFTSWNNERVVEKFNDGRIIMVLSIDPKIWWRKVAKVIDIVDQELGFPDTVLEELRFKTVYLYINDKAKQIVGCLVAEPCNTAYRMSTTDGVDSCSEERLPCKVGICRIWTALSHRRQGIATKMVNCLRKTFRFQEAIPSDMIAFTVPSPVGKQFAQKISGSSDILVYGFGL